MNQPLPLHPPHAPLPLALDAASPGAAPAEGLAPPPVTLFAFASGLLITDITATQPLVGPMGRALLLDDAQASLIATLALLGYAAGLFFIVPLADRLEVRRLALLLLGGGVAARLGLALSPTATATFAAAFAVGVASSAIQVLVPLAAAMAPVERRGEVVGNVMAGLMVGILLARPVAGVVADLLGWRAFFLMTATASALLAGLLAARLPRHRSAATEPYGALLRSMITLLRQEPVLRRRALSAALGMAAFTAFWTIVALRLTAAPFSLSQTAVAIFALAGCGTVIAAPIAGRAGDKGHTRLGSHLAHGLMLLGCALAYLGGRLAETGSWIGPVALLAAAGLLLDLGTVGDQTLGRRAINMSRPEARSRMNGLFSGIFFVGGAMGAAGAGMAYAQAGWTGTCAFITVIVLVVTALGFAEPREARP